MVKSGQNGKNTTACYLTERLNKKQKNPRECKHHGFALLHIQCSLSEVTGRPSAHFRDRTWTMRQAPGKERFAENTAVTKGVV